MAKRLTDKFLTSLKAQATGRLAIADSVVPGLCMRVTQKGAMSWLVRYRPRRQAQRGVVLGPYHPRGQGISLADARQRATEIIAAAKRGVDLIEEEARRAEAIERAKAKTRSVAQVGEDFLKAGERLKSHRQRKSYFRNHILPAIGDRIVADIKRADVVELLDGVERRGLRQTVNRVRETLLALFEFAVERQLADAN